jgi:hypothetical protein
MLDMTKSLYDPEYWKERAARARLRAEEFAGGSSYGSLLQQAQDYDRMAEAAAQHGPTLPFHPVAHADAVVAGVDPPHTSAKASAAGYGCPDPPEAPYTCPVA